MNKQTLTLVLAVFLVPLAFAGGNHAGGHQDHDSTPTTQRGAGHHEEGHHGDSHHNDGGHGHGSHASVVGSPGMHADVTRTIHVDMLDSMRFAFDSPMDHLKQGEVVRFVVTNRGRIRHEFSIGSEAEQDAHREAMRNMPDMMHDDPNAVTVEPGDTKELIWRFAGKEPAVFACNIPGHAEAGMIATTRIGE